MKKGRLIHKLPFFIYNEMHKYLLNLEYESSKIVKLYSKSVELDYFRGLFYIYSSIVTIDV